MKAIGRVLDALQTLKVGEATRSKDLAEKAGFKRAVVCAALVRKKIRKKLGDAVSYELRDRLVWITVNRELTDEDRALFIRPKKVKEPKAPRVKKEKVAKVSKKVAKAKSAEAEAQLDAAPEVAKESASQGMDTFFGTAVADGKTGE